MTTILHRTGDLFEANDVDALAHGCNCAGAMGRGIAPEFKRRWPAMYEEYRIRCHDGRLSPGEIFPWTSPEGLTIYNLGTQAHWRTKAKLDAVVSCVEKMIAHAAGHGVRRVAMPRIAAGLGGLEWDDVEAAITPALAGDKVEVIVYQLPQGGA